MPFVLFAIAQGGLWVLGTVVAMVLVAQRELYGLLRTRGAAGGRLRAGRGAALPVVAYIGNEVKRPILIKSGGRINDAARPTR